MNKFITVKQLRNLLTKFDDNMNVLYYHEDCGLLELTQEDVMEKTFNQETNGFSFPHKDDKNLIKCVFIGDDYDKEMPNLRDVLNSIHESL